MTTELTTPRASALTKMAERFSMEPEKMMATLRGTVIKNPKEGPPVTNEEVAAFVIVANEYGLNPFCKEIYAFPDRKRGGVVPIVSIDGWSRIINNQKELNGIRFQEQVDPQGQLVSITCQIYRKDRDFPIEVTEYMSECFRKTEPWETMPGRMLRHKALIQCARYAFSLSGIYDEDEGKDIVNRDNGGAEPTPFQRPVALSQRQVVATVNPVEKTQQRAQEHVDEPFTNPPEENAPAKEQGLDAHEALIDLLSNRLQITPIQALGILEAKAKPMLDKKMKGFKDLKPAQLEKMTAAANAGEYDPQDATE